MFELELFCSKYLDSWLAFCIFWLILRFRVGCFAGFACVLGRCFRNFIFFVVFRWFRSLSRIFFRRILISSWIYLEGN